MNGLGEEKLVGALALLLAAIMVWRGIRALQSGEVPLYRRRAGRQELGAARFWFAVAMQFAVALLLSVVAADLLLNLGIRPR
jgi:hypothetical protein